MSTPRLKKIGATVAAVISLVTSVALWITECTRRPYVHKSLTAEELGKDLKIDDDTRQWLQSQAHILRPATPLEPTDDKKAMADFWKFAESVRAMTPPPAPKAGTTEPPLER